jgi:hypothetical protein
MCKIIAKMFVQKKRRQNCGAARYRSLCLVHAKHALYHLSYIPLQLAPIELYLLSFTKRTRTRLKQQWCMGDVAQMEVRVLRMHEAQGSIPCVSTSVPITAPGYTKQNS